MSDDKALVPVDQRTVSFYGDEITAVLVETDENEQVFVPIRPICDLLGIAWSSQRRHILRDPILSEVMRPVTVTVTGTGQQVDALSLPLPFLNGWLFGVNADRVNPDVRERLLRYQRECYHVLVRTFLECAETAVSTNIAALVQIRENALAIAEMASLQIEHEQRLATAENRLDRAAAFVGELGQRAKMTTGTGQRRERELFSLFSCFPVVSFRRASMRPSWRFWKNGAGRQRRQNSTRYFRGPGPGSNSKRRLDSERSRCELR